MALVSQGWWMEVIFVDNGGNQTSRSYQMQAADATAAAADAATMLAELGAITNAVIAGYSYAERFAETALTLPGSGVQVEDTALVNLRLTTGLKTATQSIPAPVAGIFMGTSEEGADTVDITDADLLAFTNLFRASGSGGKFYLSDGENVKATAHVISGRRVHRRSHRRRSLRVG